MAAARKPKPDPMPEAPPPARPAVRPPRYLPDVPLELIQVRSNVRRRFDDESLAELAADIRQNGVLQPLVVRPGSGVGYALVAGERRLRAARMAELTAVPCACHDDMTDEAAARVQLLENLHRADLDPIPDDEACAFCGRVADGAMFLVRLTPEAEAAGAQIGQAALVCDDCTERAEEAGFSDNDGLPDGLEIADEDAPRFWERAEAMAR